MNYTVIGTGAIGGYYGGRLMKAGRTVRFLLRSDYEYVKEHGLQIDSCDGSFHLDGVEAYNDTRQMPKTDVVLVCLKSINNYKLREMLPPILKEDTLVVLIQNGIGVEEDLQRSSRSCRSWLVSPLSVRAKCLTDVCRISVMVLSTLATTPVRRNCFMNCSKTSKSQASRLLRCLIRRHDGRKPYGTCLSRA